MSEPISVNEAIQNLPALANQDISVTGVLSFDFEEVSISHWPKAERNDGYMSSIWLSTGSGGLQFDRTACAQLSGKRVVVQGMLSAPDPRLGGCGHMSMWPAELVARTLERHDG